jgi:Cu-Zn family superoxide dismutase
MKAGILTVVLVVTLVVVAQAQVVTRAVAVLSPTKGSTVSGTVTFTKVQTGVKIVADVSGLTPGLHGFHVHEFGDCSAPDASSAGGHFNPTQTHHGAPDMPFRHVGDFGNLLADASGKAHYERVDTIIVLNGGNSVIGHAVIVHEKVDDLQTQPTGNAGGRVACGVIGVASP